MWGLIFWVLLSFSAAIFGSRFKPGLWHAGLIKPSWNPPNWVFAPAWTLLYLLMGIAAWLVWKEGPDKRNLPLTFFVAQLVLNALWSWIFFGLHKIGWGLVDISFLWILVAATLIQFFSVSPLAGKLLIPYLAWISFATLLNWSLWRLNP